MKCPGRKCLNNYKNWRCARCQVLITYQSHRFFCLCGSGLAQTSLFKCSDQFHDRTPVTKDLVYLELNQSYKSLIPIQKSEVVQLKKNINLLITTSPALPITEFESMFLKSLVTNDFVDILQLFETTATSNSNLKITSLDFDTTSPIYVNYLSKTNALCFFLSDSTFNQQIIKKIISNKHSIVSYRTKIYLINLKSTSDTDVLYLLEREGIPFSEFYFDFVGIKNLITKYNYCGANSLHSIALKDEILSNWRQLIEEFNKLIGEVRAETINNTIFENNSNLTTNPLTVVPTDGKGNKIPNNYNFIAEIYSGTLQNVGIGRNDSSNYATDSNFISLLRSNAWAATCTSIKIFEGILTGPWVLRFDFYCTAPSVKSQWADGIAVVFSKIGSPAFNLYSTGSSKGYYQQTNIFAVDFGVRSPLYSSSDLDIHCNLTPVNLPQGVPQGIIVGARDVVQKCFLIFNEKTLTLFVNNNLMFTFTVDIYTVLGNNLTISLNGGSGTFTMDARVANLYLWK